ncbi:hypothetical protein PLESTB_000279100 [Pleodorina starrii]|uniref:Uncharacterized protein n=1 Tax=Pleodorina starrii TaxID=330485 RepID=A0A9W6BDT8_9CHLO|nr:hypothetical protein PLESTM_001410200 [Pleodorina starrii]GLC49716.1 hypothetical protein PLESTB_000279100 [Pleodorina starrii]GLC76017.1 hypothetical protein PLESTF_001721000 [Pleodorina starrii]
MQQQLLHGSTGARWSGPRILPGRRVKPSSRLVVRAQAHGSFPEEQEAEERTSTSYSPAARRAYAHIVAPQRIGAEYGEGFMQFRPGGEPRRLDVAALNEQLKAGGAIRMRFQLRPDEAYGTVFDFDAVVADTAGAYRRAWATVAAARGLPLHPLARLSMHNTAPERIIMDVLGWTSSMREARALAFELAEAYAGELGSLGEGSKPGAEPQPGVRDWLNALTSFNVPVALVSALDRATVRRALERMHLHDHFQVLVTAEDELESTAQRYLSASLQLQRPPNMCAVFGATPEAITAAHNCTMKAVAVAVSPDYPAYKLRSADVTVASLDQLTVYNLRRLFANAGDEFMDLRKQRSDDKPRNTRRVANALL